MSSMLVTCGATPDAVTEMQGATNTRGVCAATPLDEIPQLKRQRLQAAVRLAKSRTNAAGAEADVKVLGARLRAVSSK